MAPIEVSQERLDKINKRSIEYLGEYLKDIEKFTDSDNDVKESDEMLARVYALLIAAGVMGYDPVSIANDAKESTNKLLSLINDDSNLDEIKEDV